MQIQPMTDAGARFVDAVSRDAEAFRSGAADHDREGSFPVENFRALGRSGAMGAFVPEELGGLGLASIHDWAAGLCRLGAADPSTAIAINMHLGFTRTIARGYAGARARGDEAAAAGSGGLLRAVASGDIVVCATATEPGTDFLRPFTTATRAGDDWVLAGRKIFVTLSPVATHFAMSVRAPSEGDGPDAFGFALVPAGTPGLEPQDDWDALGMRASGSQSVVLRECRVPAAAVQFAGECGVWNPGILMGRTLANLTLVAVFLGIAERARELAVESAQKQTKPKFAGAIGNAPGVQQLLGEIDIDLAAARSILADTTRRLDERLEGWGAAGPGLAEAHECMRDYQCAKWVVNQNAIQVVSRAMDVCGGGAYMAGNELSRLYRDVRAGPFMQPFSPTEAREYVGRVALGQPPLG